MGKRTILNFGHFWDRNKISWGRQKVPGHLKGYRGSTRNGDIVDFREQIGIYVLFTNTREVIYIGQSGSGTQRMLSRLRQHTRDHLRSRWSNFSWFGMCDVDYRSNKLCEYDPASISKNSSLDEMEAILLQLFEPRLNKQGPKWGSETVEYFQFWESEEAEDVD